MTTVKELEAQVAKLEAENADMMKMLKETLELQRESLKRKDPKVIEDDPESVIELKEDFTPEEGGGWVIYSPNPDYTDITNGVKFVRGMGILYYDDGQDAINRLHSLRFDYGYEARVVDKEKLARLMKQMITNEAREESKPKTLEESLTSPTKM
jgi:hypothetical protein